MYRGKYSIAQWQWLNERIKEGYTVRDVSDFCELTYNTCRTNLLRHTDYHDPVPPTLEPLEKRRDEFNGIR